MSSQSIILNTIEKHSEEINEILIYNFEQYFYYKNFKLGLGADIKEMSYYRHLKDILCDNNCEIVNFIQNKIEGKLNIKPKKKKLSNYLLNLREQEGSIVDTKNYWKLVSW